MKDIDHRDKVAERQVVFSHPDKFLHGDMAVIHGFCGVQVNSKVVKSNDGVSDAHDLVIAHCFSSLPTREDGQTAVAVAAPPPLTPWPARTSATTLCFRGSQRPVRIQGASASSSAVQSAKLEL